MRGFRHVPAELPFAGGADEKRLDPLETAGRLVLAEGRSEDGSAAAATESCARDEVDQFRRSVSHQDAVRSDSDMRAQGITEFGAFGIRVGGHVDPPDSLDHPRGDTEGIDAGAEVHHLIGTQTESLQLGDVQTAMDRGGSPASPPTVLKETGIARPAMP